jgi:glycosyltransferase involved in cell wall biosynthesis
LAAAAVEALNGAGVSAELHYLRGVSNAEVPIWMNASDALLLTSVHEGSPTVVKEALACSVPVVSVDVGDVGERIEGIAGCHLSSPQPEALAAKLMLVRQADCRVSAQAKVQELSLQTIALRLDRFYRETLSLSRQTKLAF